MAKVPAVLVVDENEDSRVEVRKLLVRAGLAVAGEARYGAAAAAAAHQLQPDAIVIGIEEPPNRALETIESLATLLLETPVLAYSSLDEPDAIRRATRAGVRDYLVRPLEATALREAVFLALEQEERRQLRRAGRLPSPRPSATPLPLAGEGLGVRAGARAWWPSTWPSPCTAPLVAAWPSWTPTPTSAMWPPCSTWRASNASPV